jgi:hypothetical protein
VSSDSRTKRAFIGFKRRLYRNRVICSIAIPRNQRLSGNDSPQRSK